MNFTAEVPLPQVAHTLFQKIGIHTVGPLSMGKVIGERVVLTVGLCIDLGFLGNIPGKQKQKQHLVTQWRLRKNPSL